jgi:dipeptidyl aminopeptidase/acylaminoacyl peptidase
MLLAFSVRAHDANSSHDHAVAIRDYDRAARFLPENRDRFVLNGSVTPHWRGSDGVRFTYRKSLTDGRAIFLAVDAENGKVRPAFDHRILAAGLAKASGKSIDPDRLPFPDFEETGSGAIRFSYEGANWNCSTTAPTCGSAPLPETHPEASTSPDGKWLAYLQDHNLWIRSADGRDRFALTTDGQADYGYGEYPSWTTAEVLPTGETIAPAIVWSPDSRWLYTERVDERSVGEMTLVQSLPRDGSARPKAFHFRMALSGDINVPMATHWIFDVAARSGRMVDIDPMPTSSNLLFERLVFWSPDSRTAFVEVRGRYAKTRSLYAVDPETGKKRTVASETGATFLEPRGLLFRTMVVPLVDGSVVWCSEQDGYAHLYLYDGRTGRLIRRLTEGNWSVQGITHYDSLVGRLYIAAAGREPDSDPLYLRLYSVSLADGQVQLLTPENAAHEVAFGVGDAISPSGRYFVDTFSRPDMPPQSVLRRSDGTLVAEIERADISGLMRTGLTFPERFRATAADGKTTLYGNILRPSTFDPRKSYPVIDHVYGGPQSVQAYPGFLDDLFDDGFAQSVAELGFIVVIVDGRGTPGRSKAFHDEQYGRMGEAGHLDDHVAVIRELARRYPYMDLAHVGIYGSSTGGYAALRAILTFPDFFQVAVADAPSDGLRQSMDAWGEIYEGPEQGSNYLDTSNARLASSLKGRLLLIHGEMDAISSPTQTLRIVDALIKANKDFDLLIVPNAGHTTLTASNATPEVYHYAVRRMWDFFVRNLTNVQPPSNYDLARASKAD